MNTYDVQGRITGTYNSDNTNLTNEWSCCNKTSSTNFEGTTTQYTYDLLNRVATSTANRIKTIYNYDASSRILSHVRLAGNIMLTSHTEYDTAGRQVMSVDTKDLVTTTAYDNLVTTTTLPNGATRISTVHTDGQIKSISGTGTIPIFFEYGISRYPLCF